MHAPVYEIHCVQAGIIVTLFQFALICLFLTLDKQVKTHWLCCSPTSATADDSQGSLYLIQLLQELPELLQRHPYSKLGLFKMLRKNYIAGKEALMINTCHAAEMRPQE